MKHCLIRQCLVPTAPPPSPPVPPKKCTLGAYVGCYHEPDPNHFYAFDANTVAGKNTNDPTLTLQLCAQRCGEYAAQNPSAKVGAGLEFTNSRKQCEFTQYKYGFYDIWSAFNSANICFTNT